MATRIDGVLVSVGVSLIWIHTYRSQNVHFNWSPNHNADVVRYALDARRPIPIQLVDKATYEPYM